jgi:hypothetical protein
MERGRGEAGVKEYDITSCMINELDTLQLATGECSVM